MRHGIRALPIPFQCEDRIRFQSDGPECKTTHATQLPQDPARLDLGEVVNPLVVCRSPKKTMSESKRNSSGRRRRHLQDDRQRQPCHRRGVTTELKKVRISISTPDQSAGLVLHRKPCCISTLERRGRDLLERCPPHYLSRSCRGVVSSKCPTLCEAPRHSQVADLQGSTAKGILSLRPSSPCGRGT